MPASVTGDIGAVIRSFMIAMSLPGTLSRIKTVSVWRIISNSPLTI